MVFFLKKTFNLVFFFPHKKSYVMFCRSLFDHCIACTSSIYDCWLPLCYLQTCRCRIEKLFKKTAKMENFFFRFVNRSKCPLFYIYIYLFFLDRFSWHDSIKIRRIFPILWEYVKYSMEATSNRISYCIILDVLFPLIPESSGFYNPTDNKQIQYKCRCLHQEPQLISY